MKQVLQWARTGEVSVTDVPAPRVLPGCVLVRTGASLVSAGTERASAEFAKKNLLRKASARPDLLREVWSKARRDGVLSAWAGVQTRLDQPSPVGYSSAGTVVEVGAGINDICAEDRVACAGAGYATHGEFACVPRMLVAKVPSASVSFEEAAFSTVAAVALHGIRTAEVKLGDNVAVIGLGLLGQLTAQLLKAAGCGVIGLDVLSKRAELARGLGADAATASLQEFRTLCQQSSNGYGVDAVLITAETSDSGPVNLAAEVARDRAIVVAVGTVGMDIERPLYFKKELDFRVSRSYGPGRYDAAYEQKGVDYPIGHVRWTENRNMEAILQLLAEGKLNVRPLVTHSFPIERAQEAYDLIKNDREQSLGVMITYAHAAEPLRTLQLVTRRENQSHGPELVSVGFLGGGNFALTTLLPTIKAAGSTKLTGVCTSDGSRAHYVAKKFGFQYCTTEEEHLLADPDSNTIVIATRHHRHASQTIAALHAGKNVFCEKPLCLTEEELSAIARAQARAVGKLCVGFNRRFAPMAKRMKEFLSEVHDPLVMHYRINAGALASDHWANDPEQGGGRVRGEVCHFIDFLSFLVAAPVVEIEAKDITGTTSHGDNVVLSLRFADGSHGTISYLSTGDRSYTKERLEVFGGGSVAVLDDFRKLELIRNGKRRVWRSRFRQDKGHRAEWNEFVSSIRNGTAPPISFEEIVDSTLATLRAADSQATRKSMRIDTAEFLSKIFSEA